MATIRQRSTGNWECVIRNAALHRPHYATFDTQAEAQDYAKKLELAIKQGRIPEALSTPRTVELTCISEFVDSYTNQHAISALDLDVLRLVSKNVGSLPINKLTTAWTHDWVQNMKRVGKLAPGTIRKRVGALARCLDWHVQKQSLLANPLRQLPRGYAAYAPGDGEKRVDNERDKRLSADEELRIRLVLARDSDYTREIGKERPISDEHIDAWKLLFELALESAMRLREMYTLSVDQVNVSKKTVFLDKTKNGDKRQVPLTSIAINALLNYGIDDGRTWIFPFWDGKEPLAKTTSRLSRKFGNIANLAQCPDFRFHDLRHEATSRLYEKTTLSDLQIAKITGHKDLKMLRRYANLRGSDLAESLW